VRYAEFRDRLEDALQEAGLFFHDADRRAETIDLADTVRSWKAYVRRAAPLSAEPFHVSAVVGFEWGPYLALKIVWLSRGSLGATDPALMRDTSMIALNAATAGLDLVGIALALTFTHQW
jgi:hypothetical protein